MKSSVICICIFSGLLLYAESRPQPPSSAVKTDHPIIGMQMLFPSFVSTKKENIEIRFCSFNDLFS